MKRFGVPVLALAVVAFFAGCGGHKATTSTTTSNAAPIGAPTTEAQREQAALPMGAAAAVPADVNCGATKPVWVNLNTKSYHLSDDPYYGRTKNGKYMCASDATAQGYHAAGERHKHASASNGSPTDESSASPAPGHRHHRHSSSSNSSY